MPSQIQRLKDELESTLGMLKAFSDYSSGALNYRALKVLFENKPENSVIKVAVRDITDHFFRGEITAIRPDGETLDVLADDGELVERLPVKGIVAARIQDKM